jgi:multidrug resistance efflux pump
MDRKTEYVEKLSAQLVAWDRQLDALRYKADNAAAELKPGICAEIESLMKQRREVEQKLQRIGTASGAAWEEMKDGSDSTWDEVRTDLHDAIQNIK